MRSLIIAHRGFALEHPENSLAAFRAAVDIGAGGIELDIHSSADGALVVHHDAEIEGRPIARLTLAEIARHVLPNGEPVPVLGAALAAIGTSVEVFVEVKALDPAYDETLLAALRQGPAPGRYRVHSFDHRIVERLVRRQPSLVGGILSSSYPMDPWAQLEAARARDLWQEAALLDRPLIAGAHERGYRVYAWTVDRPERARQLAAWGVDGLCTNRPDRLREALA